MNQYSLSLIDVEPIDNKYYYRIRISTNYSSLHRDICVKIGDLMNLHRNLTSENYSHYVSHYSRQFPPFPEKSFISSWFAASDTREELMENKVAISNYLNGISKNSPLRSEPINSFVYNTVDPIRVRELKFQSCNKEQFYKINPKTSIIKKGKFGKVFRVKNNDRNEVVAIHQFLIPQQSDQGRTDMEAYKKAHSLITDYTYILKVHEIGQLVKSKPYKMFNKKQKKTIHNKMGFPPETTYDVYYAMEEFASNSMNEMIHLRQQSQQYFELEHLADAMFTLVSASQYLQFLQISQRQFLLSNFFYSEQKGFKVGGLSPMLNFKRKYYLKMINEVNEYQVMTPPEQNGTLGYKVQFPSNKADVYQIGIIVLCMCTLCQANELVSQELINDKLKLVSKNYGELLALLIKGMLERNPYDRITLQEILNGCQAVLPMKLTYLNIKEKIIKIRLRINVFGIKELEDLDKMFREKKDVHYIIVLSLEQPIIPQVFLFYLERIRKEQIHSLYINLNNQELPSELMEKICNILVLYKLYNLTINLRNSSICDKGLVALTKILQIDQKVVIDLTGCTKVKDLRCLEFINEKITVYK